MTIDDAKYFIQQCYDIDWRPLRISIIGGEPTLHKDFDEFVKLALEFVNEVGGMVEVWSNMYGRIPNEVFKRWHKVRHDSYYGKKLLEFSTPKNKHLRWNPTTIKNKSVNFLKGMTISPKDMGLDICPPEREGNDFEYDLKGCYQHSVYGDCGVSVDSVGYSICAMGGAIDGMLELGVRTKDLSKLFDKEFALKQTCDLCDNCGFQYERRTNQINWELQDNIKVVNHTHMSPTWYNALTKRKETK